MPAMWIVIVIVALALAGAGAFLRVMRAKYHPLFGDDHLFREVPQSLALLKSAALSLGSRPFHTGGPFDDEPPSDPRWCSTSARLFILYTIQDLEGGQLNRLSLSYNGGPIAFAFGGRCAFHLLTFLGVDPDAAVLADARGITHVGFLIPRAEVAEFAEAPVATVHSSAFATQRAHANEWMDRVRARGAIPRSEDELLRQLLGAA